MRLCILLAVLLLLVGSAVFAVPDCAGVEGGSKVEDRCGVCDGDNACVDPAGVACPDSEKDCAGFCGTAHQYDRCGDCNGNDARLDRAGECCDLTDRDCAGYCTHRSALDACGDCNGNNTRMDSAGVCCDAAQRGCDGLCYGLSFDRCGVCGGTNENADPEGNCCAPEERKCDGLCVSTAVIDHCGVCNGMDATMDGEGNCCDAESRGCDGLCGGAIEDKCGTCKGDNSACCGPTGDCSGNGECSAEHRACLCSPGSTGPSCQFEQDICQSLDCGTYGTCSPTGGVAVCLCANGWAGSRCQYKDCSGHGAYDPASGACKCLTPFSNRTDCRTCTEPPQGKQYVCVHSDAGARRYLISDAKVDLINVVSKANMNGRPIGVSWPEDYYDGVFYDCGCLVPLNLMHLDSAPEPASESGEPVQIARYSVFDADEALNRILISQVSYAVQTDEELRQVTDDTAAAINRSTYYPQGFFMITGFAVCVLLLAVLVAVAIWLPKIIRPLVARYGGSVVARLKGADPESD